LTINDVNCSRHCSGQFQSSENEEIFSPASRLNSRNAGRDPQQADEDSLKYFRRIHMGRPHSPVVLFSPKVSPKDLPSQQPFPSFFSSPAEQLVASYPVVPYIEDDDDDDDDDDDSHCSDAYDPI